MRNAGSAQEPIEPHSASRREDTEQADRTAEAEGREKKGAGRAGTRGPGEGASAHLRVGQHGPLEYGLGLLGRGLGDVAHRLALGGRVEDAR